ncbi:MAG: ABC transporter substrate-binding protein [Pseudomonadales bacterium]|jgi:phospholipid transport system substrate-binding protein|nr:ABC transporter substrate-binding protein [Pseudomonadales bacterium]
MKFLLNMKVFLVAGMLLVAQIVSAEENPTTLVSETSEIVRAILVKENGSNTEAVRTEVQQVLYPRFDFSRMTALAVGKYWKQATPEQKTALSDEFRTLLTRTYFSTMLRYRDAKLNVKQEPLLANDGKEATVKSDVVVGNAQQPVLIDYVLYHTEDGWKVFNVSVEGASLVTVYRNQFAEEINKGGLDGLIQSLRNKNAAPTVKAQS